MNVGQCLRGKSLCLATAESCTGGWIAQCLTDVAGSSGWFERGYNTVGFSLGSIQSEYIWRLL
ncbi:MAG: CinA family protein [Methylohalobius sp. ZOD2]